MQQLRLVGEQKDCSFYGGCIGGVPSSQMKFELDNNPGDIQRTPQCTVPLNCELDWSGVFTSRENEEGYKYY